VISVRADRKRNVTPCRNIHKKGVTPNVTSDVTPKNRITTEFLYRGNIYNIYPFDIY